MFSGIVQGTGKISKITSKKNHITLEISAPKNFNNITLLDGSSGGAIATVDRIGGGYTLGILSAGSITCTPSGPACNRAIGGSVIHGP